MSSILDRDNGILILGLPIGLTQYAICEMCKFIPYHKMLNQENCRRGLKIYFKDYDPVRKALSKRNLHIKGDDYAIYLLITPLTIHNINSNMNEQKLSKLIEEWNVGIYKIYPETKPINNIKEPTGNYRVLMLVSDAENVKFPNYLRDSTLNMDFEVTPYCRRCLKNGHGQYECPVQGNIPTLESTAFTIHISQRDTFNGDDRTSEADENMAFSAKLKQEQNERDKKFNTNNALNTNIRSDTPCFWTDAHSGKEWTAVRAKTKESDMIKPPLSFSFPSTSKYVIKEENYLKYSQVKGNSMEGVTYAEENSADSLSKPFVFRDHNHLSENSNSFKVKSSKNLDLLNSPIYSECYLPNQLTKLTTSLSGQSARTVSLDHLKDYVDPEKYSSPIRIDTCYRQSFNSNHDKGSLENRNDEELNARQDDTTAMNSTRMSNRNCLPPPVTCNRKKSCESSKQECSSLPFSKSSINLPMTTSKTGGSTSIPSKVSNKRRSFESDKPTLKTVFHESTHIRESKMPICCSGCLKSNSSDNSEQKCLGFPFNECKRTAGTTYNSRNPKSRDDERFQSSDERFQSSEEQLQKSVSQKLKNKAVINHIDDETTTLINQLPLIDPSMTASVNAEYSRNKKGSERDQIDNNSNPENEMECKHSSSTFTNDKIYLKSEKSLNLTDLLPTDLKNSVKIVRIVIQRVIDIDKGVVNKLSVKEGLIVQSIINHNNNNNQLATHQKKFLEKLRNCLGKLKSLEKIVKPKHPTSSTINLKSQSNKAKRQNLSNTIKEIQAGALKKKVNLNSKITAQAQVEGIRKSSQTVYAARRHTTESRCDNTHHPTSDYDTSLSSISSLSCAQTPNTIIKKSRERNHRENVNKNKFPVRRTSAPCEKQLTKNNSIKFKRSVSQSAIFKFRPVNNLDNLITRDLSTTSISEEPSCPRENPSQETLYDNTHDKKPSLEQLPSFIYQKFTPAPSSGVSPQPNFGELPSTSSEDTKFSLFDGKSQKIKNSTSPKSFFSLAPSKVVANDTQKPSHSKNCTKQNPKQQNSKCKTKSKPSRGLSKKQTPGLWFANKKTSDIMDCSQFMLFSTHVRSKAHPGRVVFKFSENFDQVIQKIDAVLEVFFNRTLKGKNDNSEVRILEDLRKRFNKFCSSCNKFNENHRKIKLEPE